MGAYVLYTRVHDSDVQVALSGAPLSLLAAREDRAVSGHNVILLSHPLPLWIAESALQEIVRTKWGSRVRWRLPFVLLALRVTTHRVLARFGEKGCWRPIDPSEAEEQLPSEAEVEGVYELLSGRILLEDEVYRLLAEEGEGQFIADPVYILEQLVIDGRALRRAAVTRDTVGKWRCRRCGSLGRVDIGPCARCGRDACAACTECATFGVARACEGIVAVKGRATAVAAVGTVSDARPLLQLDYDLSPAQAAAAESLLNAATERSLIWAACGAGKTEVVFQRIEEELQRGQSVLFAVPRRDIAKELGDRLRQAFPKVGVKALYGGAPQRFSSAQLIVATTHQTLRFYRRFPLAILDEVDAFPYRGNTMLRRGIERALAPGGRLIYMTATPTDSLLKRAKRDGWTVITIPARHHGRPLPLPEIVELPALTRLRNDVEQGAQNPHLPKELVERVQRMVRASRPLLVFVPTVRLVEPMAKVLDSICRSGAQPSSDALPLACGIHARHARRDALRESFQRGEFPVLVATTVLERGVTIPGVNVIVLWADYERVFDAPTLIQMAGRAGRTTEFPTGIVQFIGVRQSRAMVLARDRIDDLNREAQSLGYFRTAGLTPRA